jgi:hypothetical protein
MFLPLRPRSDIPDGTGQPPKARTVARMLGPPDRHAKRWKKRVGRPHRSSLRSVSTSNNRSRARVASRPRSEKFNGARARGGCLQPAARARQPLTAGRSPRVRGSNRVCSFRIIALMDAPHTQIHLPDSVQHEPRQGTPSGQAGRDRLHLGPAAGGHDRAHVGGRSSAASAGSMRSAFPTGSTT